LKTRLVIKLDFMKQKCGTVSSYCEKHNLNRQALYNLNGASYVSSEKNKALLAELIDRGLASWEVVKDECVA